MRFGANTSADALISSTVHWLLCGTRRLRLEQLPRYALELNHVEPQWSWLKWGLFAINTTEGAELIDINLRQTLRSMCRSTQRLRSFFKTRTLRFPDEALVSWRQ
jgi:hypothetical protein